MEPHPAFAVLSAPLDAGAIPPTLDALNALARASPAPPRSSGGAAIRFVAARQPLGSLEYETEILRTGAVPTRDGNVHDACNALCWVAFPRLKRAINAAHVARAPTPGAPGRGAARDALTLLDESGMLVLCADAELAALLARRQWKQVFWLRRGETERALRFLACGHALFEKLLAPYPGITAKALFVPVAPALFDEPIGTIRSHADAAAAARVEAGILPADLHPLPVAGIPGWHPANGTTAFYDDAAVFRPAHAATAAGRPATSGHSACAPARVNSSRDP